MRGLAEAKFGTDERLQPPNAVAHCALSQSELARSPGHAAVPHGGVKCDQAVERR